MRKGIKVLITESPKNQKIKSLLPDLDEKLIDSGSDYIIIYLDKEEVLRLEKEGFTVLYDLSEEV